MNRIARRVCGSERRRRRARARGFSLIELAIVLLIVGVMLGAVIRPIVSDGENRVISETRAVLDEAREAVLSYVAANGYFPCPADPFSNGAEAAPNHLTGACGIWHGFLPARALGVTSGDAQGYAVDGGRQPQNRIRYAVSNEVIAGIANPFTRINGLRLVSPSLSEAENLLFVCSSNAGVIAGVDCGGVGNTLTSRAVVVIWSVGGNALSGGTSLDERENPNPNGGSEDRIFVSRARSVAAGAEFDDLLYWIPTTLLVNRLLAYGQLP